MLGAKQKSGMSDKELLNTLQDRFNQICKNLSTHGNDVCGDEINKIHQAITWLSDQLLRKDEKLFSSNDKKYLFQDIIRTLNSVIEKINKEEDLLENEMHGPQNFTHHMYRKIKVNYEFKEYLKKELKNMVNLVFIMRPDIESATGAEFYTSPNR